MTKTMNAIRFHPPGGPEKLRYEKEAEPTAPEDGQVIIQVRAVGLIWTELTWPIYQDANGRWISHIPGHDYSGVITALGPGCEDSGLAVGTEVCAFTSRRNHEGGLAEFAKADVDQVVPKPSNLSFAEAATVPLSALTAWQALFVRNNLKKGQRLLITAGAGGTGIFAVQFAKNIGAYVIATGSTTCSRELLEGFGVDEFIDYKKTALEDAVQDVDMVLDCVGDRVIDSCFKVVKKEGVVVSIASFTCMEKAAKLSIKCDFFIVQMDAGQLKNITKLIEDGSVRPVLDKTFPLERTQDAFAEGGRGGGAAHGKIVITVP